MWNAQTVLTLVCSNFWRSSSCSSWSNFCNFCKTHFHFSWELTVVWQSLLLFSLLAMISSVAFGHRHFPSFSNSQSFGLFLLLYLLTLKFWLCLQFFSLWAPEIVFIIVMCGTFITAVAALPTVIQRLCCGKSDFRRLLYHDNVVFFVSADIRCDVSTGCCFCCSTNLLPILLSYPVTVISVAVCTYCHFCCRIHLLSFL